MRLRKRFASLLTLAVLVSPATAQTPAPYDFQDLATTPFSMGENARFGALTYAGGLYMTAPTTTQFGGVSGIEAEDAGGGVVKFSAITDFGQFLVFNGALDEDGRLIGAGNLAMTTLRDVGGEPLGGKSSADAEDLTRPPDAPGWLISFEGRHRITAYADPFDPKAEIFDANQPAETRSLPSNEGIEGLAALPGGRMAVGAENGTVWLCRAKGDCAKVRDKGGMGPFMMLTGLDYLAGTTDELVSTWRRPRPFGGFDVLIAHIAIKDGHATTTTLAKLPPYVDNIEGISAVPRVGGGYRLYVVSDNNMTATRTRLLAFDWVR